MPQGEGNAIDRVVEVRNAISGVRPSFPQKSGRFVVTVPIIDPIARQSAGQIHRALRATPGLTSITMRNFSE
jgi:hypothetical protein